jgi:DNA-binding transcriptional MerR regulator
LGGAGKKAKATRSAQLPDKEYFKIGEVAALVGVETYVLRYWETEFSALCPEKTRSNQRLYRRRDVETVLQIKRLLHDEGFRIEAARRRLGELIENRNSPATALDRLGGVLRRELEALEKIIDEDEAS